MIDYLLAEGFFAGRVLCMLMTGNWNAVAWAVKLSKAGVKRGLAGLIFDLKADSLVGDWW